VKFVYFVSHAKAGTVHSYARALFCTTVEFDRPFARSPSIMTQLLHAET